MKSVFFDKVQYIFILFLQFLFVLFVYLLSFIYACISLFDIFLLG